MGRVSVGRRDEQNLTNTPEASDSSKAEGRRLSPHVPAGLLSGTRKSLPESGLDGMSSVRTEGRERNDYVGMEDTSVQENSACREG